MNLSGNHIRFDGPFPWTSKTSRWSVMAKATRAHLGEIRWFGRWRCYSFFPAADTVFERACLRDIATFCEEQTKAHLAARKLAALSIQDAHPAGALRGQ